MSEQMWKEKAEENQALFLQACQTLARVGEALRIPEDETTGDPLELLVAVDELHARIESLEAQLAESNSLHEALVDGQMIDQTINELDELHLNLAQNNISKAAAADWLGKLIARLRAQRAAGNVPDGYALVPIEPTRKMYEASINSGSPWNITDAYKAMLAAAPTQPTTEQEGKGL